MDARTAVVPFRTVWRRRAAALAGLVITAGSLAACGSAGSTGAADGAGSTAPSASASASAQPSAPASPSPSDSPTATPAPTGPGIAVGEPAPTAVKLPATGYQVQNGTELTVYFFGGVCDKYGLRADESMTGQVRVRVVIAKTADPGKECPRLVKQESVTAQLSKPLDGRKVVDLASGTTLGLSGDMPGGPR
ncbi:hypothetical protein [Kitasatospora sp. NPDC059571]|uniref:hypothetical protein n=1 Tax=Kitasatospora sp. NPDC059571 TaxID=3346871 RepID=UPI0036A590B3